MTYLMNNTIDLHWNNKVSIANRLQEATKQVSCQTIVSVVQVLPSRGLARTIYSTHTQKKTHTTTQHPQTASTALSTQ